MEFLHEFGLDPVLLIAQIINFLIVFFILKKFLYRPVLDLLKNREVTIKKGLEQAEEARVLLEKASEKEKAILKKAQSEARELLDETREQRTLLLSEAEESARKQTEKMLNEAREQILEDTNRAKSQLSRHVAEFAVMMLERSGKDLFASSDQETAIKTAIKKLRTQKVG